MLPCYQGERVGRFLFEQATHFVRKHSDGPCTLELNVNRQNTAVGFYEHMGMHKVRQEDNDIGNGFFMNDYVMSMEL